MPRAVIRENPTHFQQTGSGPAIVLIHGLFCNIGFWWFGAAPLLSHGNRVIAFDLRGHGLSGMPATGYRAVDIAADGVALIDHLGLEQVHVLGHSFGGAVALAIAAHHPEAVSEVTLADAWIPALQPLPRAQRIRAEGQAVAGTDRPALPQVVHGFMEEVADYDHGDNRLAANGLIEFYRGATETAATRRTPMAIRRWQRLMAQTTAPEDVHDETGLGPREISGIETPVNLIYGSRSRFQPSREGLEGLLPRSRTATIPGAGHFFPFFRPAAMKDALAELQ